MPESVPPPIEEPPAEPEVKTPASSGDLTARIAESSTWVEPLRKQMHCVLIGQEALVDHLLIGLLTNGHILLEGVPGLAKTLTVNALAGCLDCSFQRLQFTPDLLPADLVGTLIFNPGDGEFTPKLGPVFANLILADEVNRAPAKVQSALLEAMQERQVTIGDTTYPLPDPFLVLATQNPIEQEGTYTLPEAQLDRFLFKVKVDYPTQAEERQILDLMATSAKPPRTTKVTSIETIAASRSIVNEIHIEESVRDYIVSVICATRNPSGSAARLAPLIRCGSSPRGTINLTLAARANAFLDGRGYVTPQDIKDLAPEVLRHRILLTYEAEAEGVTPEDVIEQILDTVPLP